MAAQKGKELSLLVGCPHLVGAAGAASGCQRASLFLPPRSFFTWLSPFCFRVHFLRLVLISL